MMRFLRGTFFRIGGVGYNDFEDFTIQESPPPINLGLHAVLTQGMAFGTSVMFTREYVPPPPRPLYEPSDSFDRTNLADATHLWLYPTQSPAPNRPVIASNHIQQGQVSVDCCSFWGPAGWEVDPFRPESIIGQYSQIQIASLPHTLGTNYLGVVVSCDGLAGSKFYLGQLAPSAVAGKFDARLFFWNGTAFVNIGTSNNVLPWVVGDILRLEVTGKGVTGNPIKLKLLKNSTAIFLDVQTSLIKAGGGTDAQNLPSPGIAIRGQDATGYMDNWRGGEIRPPADHLFHRENWNQHADGALGQPWGFPFAQPRRPGVASHQVIARGLDNWSTAYYGGTGFNASDHYSQARIVALPTLANEKVGVTVRTGGGVDAYYSCVLYWETTIKYAIWLYWNDGSQPPGNGVFTRKIFDSSYVITTAGMLRAEVRGTNPATVLMYYGGVLLLTYDFTSTSGPGGTSEIRIGGFPGMTFFDPTGGTPLALDDWEGGVL